MAQFKFNEFNPQGYNNFVPLATKKSNGIAFKVIIGLIVVGGLFWCITRPSEDEAMGQLDVNKE